MTRPAVYTPPAEPSVALTTLYVDGMPLDDLNALYDYNTQVLGGTKWNGPNQFWATPSRDQHSTVREVFDVSIGTAKLVNRLSFQVSKFPAKVSVEYLAADGSWKPLRRAKAKTPVTLSLTESVPRRIHPGVFDKAHRHPHHRAAGHWHDIEIHTKAVRTSRIRLVLERFPSRHTPVAISTGKPTAYSLAVKDFQYGYEVTSAADVPQMPGTTQQVAESSAFATSTDLLGSAVEFRYTEYDAADLLWPNLAVQAGVPTSQAEGYGEIWKCEPQPFPYAVVNLFVDARDASGQGQPVDRFYLNPTTTGVGVNLYYSNDDPDLSAGFPASSEAIRYPGLQPHGDLTADQSGITFEAPYGYLDLDRNFIRPDLAQPWWLGVQFQPLFDATETTEHVILATPYFEVAWRNQWEVNVAGASLALSGSVFVAGSGINLALAWDGETLSATILDDTGVPQTLVAPGLGILDLRLDPAALAANPDLAQTWRFGGALVDTAVSEGDPGSGLYRLNALVLKQEMPTAQATADWFGLPPTTYLLASDLDYEDEPYDHTDNALLRVLPFFQTSGTGSRNPYGFVGGPANAYERLVWTPINRDFKMAKGYLKFDPVRAKYFKFEFSNLAPQTYSAYAPMQRTVRLFSAETVRTSLGIRYKDGPLAPQAGTTVNINSSASPLFSDQSRVRYLNGSTTGYDGYTPTEALYSADPGAQTRLEALGPSWRLQPWHRPAGMPRFTQTQQHFYETVTVSHKSDVAYFVGLAELRMYRVDYTVADDTDAYLLPFHDRAGLDDAHDLTPWLSDTPNGLVTPGALTTGAAVTTSLPLLSRRAVRGIQFATVQTPALQRLVDADFTDPDHTHWVAYGSAAIEQGNTTAADLGSTLQVSRDTPSSTWNAIEFADWPTDLQRRTWADVEALGTWDAIENPASNDVSYGGVQGAPSALYQPAPKGRIYAAARVYAPAALHAPLHLQIVDALGGVLAEEQIVAKPGGVTEWYTGYTLGSAAEGDAVIPTFAQQEAVGTWADLEALGTWSDVMGGYTEPYSGPVTVRLYQAEPTKDDWFVDNLSLYEDPIVWEFSNDSGATWWPGYDIRNDPHGVLLFPEDFASPSLAATSSLQWRVTSYQPGVRVQALFIRPWYSTLSLGVPVREGINHGGANISQYDQYPEITDSAPFKQWSKPIPEDWWFAYRQWLLQGGIPTAQIAPPPVVVPVEAYLSDALLYAPAPAPQIVLGEAMVLPPPPTAPAIVLGDGLSV